MTDSKGRRVAEEVSRGVDPSRRNLLKLILGAAGAYAAPAVASFAMQDGGGAALATTYMTPM